jgi:iron complex outermembrane recepter protein
MLKTSAPQPQRLAKLISLAFITSVGSAAFADTVDLGTVGASGAAGSTVSVKAERGTAASVAPTQASLSATQPQSIVSRAFIEDSTPPTGNFNTILAIAPSVASMPSTNGPGMADQKMSLRGFQDGEYNVTFDGIPFGDSNGPTHHSTSYFPASVIGGMVIDRGPGNASNVGYSTYGGSVNLFSKAPSQTKQTSVYGALGNWGTRLEGISYESGRMEGSDATLQVNAQNMAATGYLSNSPMDNNNLTVKYQRPLGDSTLMTIFGSANKVKSNVTDNASGPTMAQVALLGKNYVMNSNPASQGFYGYNTATKTTDMDYVRLQTTWANGWQTDNQTYTYAYANFTEAGQDPSKFNGTADSSLTVKNLLGASVTVPNGGVPGYHKLNSYRVWGDILKATKNLDNGLLRVGAWYEGSKTDRHNMEDNAVTGAVLPGASSAYPAGIVTTTNFTQQNSSWSQIQPFVEFEWAAAPGLTITPGYKAMNYNFHLDSAFNQKALTAQSYNNNYKASLPFLTVNKKLDDQNSLYAQYAKGMQVPFIGVGTATGTRPDPQTTTNYQVGAVHKSDRLTIDGDLYYITMNNMQLNTGTNANPQFTNVGGALYKGVEGQAAYMLGDGWSAFANFGYNLADYSASNAAAGQPIGQVPNAPKVTTAFGAIYNLGDWTASLLYKHIGEQLNTKLQGQLPAINNADLNVGYTFRNMDNVKALKVQLSVFNLTNSQQIVGVTGPLSSASTQYQWQAPRSMMISAKADF